MVRFWVDALNWAVRSFFWTFYFLTEFISFSFDSSAFIYSLIYLFIHWDIYLGMSFVNSINCEYATNLAVSFINKENTFYVNAILQVLSALPSVWIRLLLESPSLSPLLKSITLNMKIKCQSNKPVDPSNFLWAFSSKISESRHAQFNFNSQQDAAEVLQFVIDELKGTSVAASDLISNTIRINVSCNQCLCFSA